MDRLLNNKAVIGVDLGGTNISVGKVIAEDIVKEVKRPVPVKVSDPQIITDFIIDTVKSVIDEDIIGVGMGVPGLLNRKEGIIYDVQNIPLWRDIPLRKIMEEEFNVPVLLDNDANCFALGERIYGKGKKTDNFVGVTLGTGIGAGIFSGGDLHDDLNCGSGEFGMIPYLDATFEDYCSGKFFKRKYETNGIDMFTKVLSNDKKAIQAYKEFGFHLGNFLKTIIFSVDPEKIILGGSIAEAGMYFKEEMISEMGNRVISGYQKHVIVEFSELKSSAILGAAAVYFNALQHL